MLGRERDAFQSVEGSLSSRSKTQKVIWELLNVEPFYRQKSTSSRTTMDTTGYKRLHNETRKQQYFLLFLKASISDQPLLILII